MYCNLQSYSTGHANGRHLTHNFIDSQKSYVIDVTLCFLFVISSIDMILHQLLIMDFMLLLGDAINHATDLGRKLVVKGNEGKTWTTGTQLSIPFDQLIAFHSFICQTNNVLQFVVLIGLFYSYKRAFVGASWQIKLNLSSEGLLNYYSKLCTICWVLRQYGYFFLFWSIVPWDERKCYGSDFDVNVEQYQFVASTYQPR